MIGIWDLTPDFMWFIARCIVLVALILATLGLGQFFAWAMEWIYLNVSKFR